jgi:hypothetical protein
LAEKTCQSAAVESLRFEGENVLVVGTRSPQALAERIAEGALEAGIMVREMVPGDRSLEGLFGRLVHLHRGVAP